MNKELSFTDFTLKNKDPPNHWLRLTTSLLALLRILSADSNRGKPRKNPRKRIDLDLSVFYLANYEY